MLLRCFSSSLGLIAALLLPYSRVSADCECGYSINSTGDALHQVFTEVLESDFTTISNISLDTDWVAQEWKVEPEASKGPYGRQTMVTNIISNPVKNLTAGSEGINGGPSGIELYVRKVNQGERYVPVAELDSYRSDMLYGSFRAAFQTTKINGTCAAFFWYLNDTQEIDMEFLSAQMNATTSPVNLVLHSIQSLMAGGDASVTPTFKLFPLPFHPGDGFHEYRFDWKPGSVTFYADGKWLVEMTEEEYVPSVPGKIVLSHWSNGQPLWSGGPPSEDSKLVVSYAKAYFNSSDHARQADFAKRCKNPSAVNATCRIPDQIGPPKFGDYNFFSKDPSGNKTNNQTIWAPATPRSGGALCKPWLGATSILAAVLTSLLMELL